MEVLPEATTVGFVFFFLLASSQVLASEKVKCYVCSWSPDENRTGEYCTKDNFNSNMAHTMECPEGCEDVHSYDNNNKLELFHRNCYTSNDTSGIKTGCNEEKTLSYNRVKCVCVTDFCNTAAPVSLLMPGAVFLVGAALAWQMG